MDSTNWWRKAQEIRTLSLCNHLTYPECLEIMVKRYKRWQRTIRDTGQGTLFPNEEI